MDSKDIRSEENSSDIMTKNCSEADHAKHVKIITEVWEEGELWEIVETGREDFNNNWVMDGVTNCDSDEYSIHALANTVNQENVNEWLLGTISMNGKKMWTTYLDDDGG